MAHELLKITTPRGAVFQTSGKNGEVTATLEWDPGFGARQTEKFSRAQMFIDSEMLRACSSRVPFDTGMLQKSGILGTVVGSGFIEYITPYAAAQYYNTATSRSYDHMRGGQWFERAKVDERQRVLRGAARLAGGEPG